MKTSLCLAALSLACTAAAAQSTLTVAGTVDLALRRTHYGSIGSLASEVSGANSTSKLVIRGTEELGGELIAGFYLDSTIAADTGGGGASYPTGQLWDRRATVSLAAARFGELRLGRDWVPTHLVWSGFDPFATLGIASANTFRSFNASRALGQAFGTAPESQAANPTLRVSNVAEYFLPSGLAGFYGNLIASAGEGGATASGFTKGDGFRVGWAGHGLNVAAAQFTTRNATGSQRFKDQVFGASYDFGVATLNLAQRRWIFGPDRTVSTMLSGTIPAGRGLIKLTLVRADQTGATAAQDANDATLIGAGYVYNLSKRTALYAHAARVTNDAAAIFTIPGGPPMSANPAAANYFGGQTTTSFEAGLRHDF